jgi:hypothetical protein
MNDMKIAIQMLRQQMESEEKVAISARKTAISKREEAARLNAEADTLDEAGRKIKAVCGEKPNKDGTRSGPFFMCESNAKGRRASAANAAQESETAARTAEAHEARAEEFAAAIRAIGGKVDEPGQDKEQAQTASAAG